MRHHTPYAGPALAATLATGLAVVGLATLGQRRARQRDLVARHPDDAPARDRRAAPPGPRRTGHAVTINRPRAELYAFWRDFRNLPKFMTAVEKVTPGTSGRATWTIAAPGGSPVDLETEVTEERDGELIAWRTLPGSAVEARGRVRFRDATGGRGTVVDAEVAYDPPGGEIGRWVAKLFQREPGIQGRRELKRFKMLMETGEIATSDNHK
ncbi:SRPBCC family protein [Amaricoccus solimangrovi]|uniref:SRPBCC family protein n=1 Tax=Amaricoccus solimangrovi TaxID=2589815 RepID=A0A501WU44_9RHOB|nr:SRPBCC family protein [Amaricoccus solimangrovi]TPE51674.1 SRPBCC family protein [Amaricoccus solimangrovi]